MHKQTIHFTHISNLYHGLEGRGCIPYTTFDFYSKEHPNDIGFCRLAGHHDIQKGITLVGILKQRDCWWTLKGCINNQTGEIMTDLDEPNDEFWRFCILAFITPVLIITFYATLSMMLALICTAAIIVANIALYQHHKKTSRLFKIFTRLSKRTLKLNVIPQNISGVFDTQ